MRSASRRSASASIRTTFSAVVIMQVSRSFISPPILPRAFRRPVQGHPRAAIRQSIRACPVNYQSTRPPESICTQVTAFRRLIPPAPPDGMSQPTPGERIRTGPMMIGTQAMEPIEQTILRLRRRERIRELRNLIVISSKLALPFYALFSIADHFYAPHRFLLFTVLRILVVPSYLLVIFAVKRTRSLTEIQAWGAFHVFVNAILITIMAFLVEGNSSPYYAGLNLIAIMVGSFIPWTSAALACNIALIYLPFFALSFLTWGRQSNSIFIVNSLFMFATIFLTLVIRYFNERFRIAAIRSRVALQDELERRADIIQEKTEEAIRLQEQFRQSQKMEAMGRLAGGIAHDFNNLLMVIQSYTEMLQDHLPAEDGARNNTEQVLKAAAAGNQSHQTNAGLQPQTDALPRRARSECRASMTRRKCCSGSSAKTSNFESFPTHRSGPIEADPDQIVQVVMNLCVNARDAMEHGGTLTIATENVTSTEMRLRRALRRISRSNT